MASICWPSASAAKPLIDDPQLKRIASAHAAQILADEEKAHLDEVMALLRLHGTADAQILPFAVVGASLSELEVALRVFQQEQAEARGYTHRGIEHRKSKQGKRYALVGIFSRRLIDIGPLPTLIEATKYSVPILPSSLALGSGSKLAEVKVTSVRGYLSTPRGNIKMLDVRRNWTTGEAQIDVPITDGPGTYVFEILVDGPRGPEVSALWRFDHGRVTRKRRAPPEKMKLPDSRSTLSALLRRSRVQASRKPLRRNKALDKAAQQHAKAICEHRLAAHVLPGGASPHVRSLKHGFTGAVTENVAMAQTVGRAHENLMESPSHRRNIISPDFTELGLGLASRPARAVSSRYDKRPSRTWCVVQMFGTLR